LYDLCARKETTVPSGIVVQENFGASESFEKTPTGVRMNFTKDGHRGIAKATPAVVAVGRMADTSSEHLR
jgi:dihydrolipoamide dehydrogenase